MIEENLKNLRESKGLKQKEVAQILNLSSATYNTYERGISIPPIETLCKIADYFNISLDELVGRDFAQAGTELENELLKTIKQLSLVEQAKVLGYAKARIEAQTEIKDIKVRTGYKG